MNDDRRRLLTEYIGEVWVEHDNPNQQIYVGKVCIDKSTLSNRTFTTWADLGAVRKALERHDDVSDFLDLTFWKYAELPRGTKNEGGYVWWLFTPARFCELAAEFLEGRK